MTDARQQIVEQLGKIEKEEQIIVLYACESGSRAWGFPSKDSDYDVRFIYVRTADWYLSIFDKRDVIERPINDMLELDFEPRIDPINEFLDEKIGYYEQMASSMHSSNGIQNERLDELFRSVLKEVWDSR